jgi:hypothetical protein
MNDALVMGYINAVDIKTYRKGDAKSRVVRKTTAALFPPAEYKKTGEEQARDEQCCNNVFPINRGFLPFSRNRHARDSGALQR